jgi:TRAP-type C4-dicarboxylate transport system permease small subunit
LYARLFSALGALAGALVGLMVVLVCIDVVGRNLGVTSLPWIIELTELTLPLATLLAAPWLLHRNEHVRLDLLHNVVPARQLARLDRLVSVIGVVLCATVVWYSIRVIQDNIAIGALVMKSFVFPEWWLFVPLPLSFGLMAVEFARRVLRAPAGQPEDAAGGPGGLP